ncbi:MAG: response regulator [Bacteroidota bacterium]
MKGQPQVLVVDNDKNILAAFRVSLAGRGCRPIICSNAADALSKVNRLRVDVVVTELHLDGLVESGFAFLTNLRHAHPHLPIIVISYQLDAEVEKRLKSIGINAFFPKPLELRSLKRTIKSLLMSGGGHGSRKP